MRRGRLLYKGATMGNGNPLDTLVEGQERKENKCATTESQNERTRDANAVLECRGRGWEGGRADLKVSRAVEKLAHLISNGSFNNIPRRPSHGPPCELAL